MTSVRPRLRAMSLRPHHPIPSHPISRSPRRGRVHTNRCDAACVACCGGVCVWRPLAARSLACTEAVLLTHWAVMGRAAREGIYLVLPRRHTLGAVGSYSWLSRGDILTTGWRGATAPQVLPTFGAYGLLLAAGILGQSAQTIPYAREARTMLRRSAATQWRLTQARRFVVVARASCILCGASRRSVARRRRDRRWRSRGPTSSRRHDGCSERAMERTDPEPTASLTHHPPPRPCVDGGVLRREKDVLTHTTPPLAVCRRR